MSRRGFLQLTGAGVVAAALAACGAEPTTTPRRNPGASKADGRILFVKNTNEYNGKDDGIYLMENAGKSRKVIGEQGDDYALQYPRWSPDGTRFAYVRVQDRGAYSNLWIANADGGNPQRITDFMSKRPFKGNVDAQGLYVQESAIVAGVSWSRNNWITFASDRLNPAAALRPWLYDDPNQPPAPKNLYVIPATANFSPANADVKFHIDDTALAPDNSAMAFVAFWVQPDDWSNRQTQIYALDFGTKKYAQLTEFKWGAYAPAYSPDGRVIAFTGRPDYRVNDLHVMTRDGKNQVLVPTGGAAGAARSPVWSPDGKRLAFLSGVEGGQFSIWAMDVNRPADGSPLTAADFGKAEKIADEKGIDARSGLSWTG